MVDPVVKILEIFHKNGLFDEGVELIGSWCFYLYQKHLNVKSYPLRTQDIDFLIPRPFNGNEHLHFIEQLEAIGFRRAFQNDGTIYFWNADLKIEFITLEKGQGADGPFSFKKLGINAIPLRFVNILLDNPIIVNEGGVRVLLPNPANFCLQKLIIASRRRKPDKSLKDLEQAILASEVADPKKLYEHFVSFPRNWQKTILRMIKKAQEELPLLSDEIDALIFILQERKK